MSIQLHEAETGFLLIVALRDNPYALEIAAWLIKNRPHEIQESDIMALIYESGSLKTLSDPNNQDGISILGKLSQSAQSVVSQGLRRLVSVINTAATYATASKAFERKPGNEIADESEAAKKFYKQLEEAVTEVRTETRDALLLERNVDDILGQDAVDEIASRVGAKSALDLKQNVLGKEPISDVDELELPVDSLGVPKGSRFWCGLFQGGPVVVEMSSYTPAEDSTDVSAKDLPQIRRMVGQLAHPERTSDHVLRCAGFIQYRYEEHIGLVFHLENGCDIASPPVMLHDLYKASSNKLANTTMSKNIKVHLGLRFQVAHNLAVALEGLHRVGWVHKDIQSKNVVFFHATTSEMMDPDKNIAGLGNLYLFGFESSRPDDAETDLSADYSLKNNAYRHPHRWGKPSVKFTKAHDIYSLVMPVHHFTYSHFKFTRGC